MDLLHRFDSRNQQFRNLFLWNLQRTHTESYGVNNIERVSKHNVSMCQGWVRLTNRILPSYGTSSSHWPGGTWTEPRGLSCRAETKQANDKSAVFIHYNPLFHFLSLLVLSTSPQPSPPPHPITCNCLNVWMIKYEWVILVSCTAINRNWYHEVMCMCVRHEAAEECKSTKLYNDVKLKYTSRKETDAVLQSTWNSILYIGTLNYYYECLQSSITSKYTCVQCTFISSAVS